jgi:undecaprenyl-diphosphatase
LPPSLDLTLLEALYAGRLSAPWVDLIVGVTFLGSGWMMLGLLPALFVRVWRIPAAAVLVMLGTVSAVVALLKEIAGRVRPCQALTWARALPISLPTDCSFPSGHAAGTFAFAVFVLTLNRRAGAVLVPLATLIGLSRVALGVHYPSDVLAGAVLGSLMGWAAARFYVLARER